MTTQQLVQEAIERAVHARRPTLTLIDDRQRANTGTLRTYDADLTLVGSVTYDFQHGYCHFGPAADRVAAHWYGQTDMTGKAAWGKGSLAELVAAVADTLIGATS